MPHTILVIDDEKDIRTSLSGILEDEGYQVLTAASGAEGIDTAQQELPDLVLLDIWMPGMDGLEALERLKQLVPQVTVIMISGHGTIETAVRATKLGAFDFIEKPLSLEKVLISVANALHLQELKTENAELKRTATADHELIGDSPGMVALREQIMRAAPTSTCVRIDGENGTDREQAARALHHASPRRERPFIAVNCSSIPGELLEIELFGNEKGVGAASQRKGKCDLADGGTLFLNEIGELSPASQMNVARIIKEGYFTRVGGGRQIAVDVRVLASTARELDREAAQGKFHEELLHLLDVVRLRVPPLRERKEDVTMLVQHFVTGFYRREGQEAKAFLPDALRLLSGYDWPGNLRELQNTVERILIMTPGRVIDVPDLPEQLRRGIMTDQQLPESPGACSESSLRLAREAFEREFIVRKLEEHDWNISRTAEIIELERSNLHRKIKSYGIDVRK
ncbi:MAG TPA: sigma-54-dependent Fis family transcriptional regulator [Desulfuromonadales bacterium]|nr:sigma-54-dependent Fis family transcriptional regulator [Desulfuromonadales bacterium]